MGTVFVTEEFNNHVFRSSILIWATHIALVVKGHKPGELNDPRGIAIDQDGMVYVSDYGNHRIQKFTSEGDVMAVVDNKISFILSIWFVYWQ